MSMGVFIDCVQGTPDWFQEKLGRISASQIADVFAFSKRDGQELQARRDYKIQVVSEMLTGRVVEKYVSAAMLDGTGREPLARAAYEEQRDVEVELVGFVIHPRIPRAGCSPDGLVGSDGLVEFKCPMMTTHTKYLLMDQPPEEYWPQMMWQMACTGRQWCDFVSYDSRFENGLDLAIRRLYRDDDVIAKMERGVEQFLGEVDEMLAALKRPKVPTEEILAAQEKLAKRRKKPDLTPTAEIKPQPGLGLEE